MFSSTESLKKDFFLVQNMEWSYYVSMPSVYKNHPVVQTVQSQADNTNDNIFPEEFNTLNL